MPRFLSQESRRRWTENRRQTYTARKATKQPQASALLAEVHQAEVMARPAVMSPLAGLDDKIAQLQAELAILEQAREILSR